MTVEIQPEDERLIEEKLRSGAYRSVDELIYRSLATLPALEPSAQEPSKHLADLLSGPPFAGSDLNLGRQRSYNRDVE